MDQMPSSTLEPDRVLLERIGDEQESLLQADGAGVGDALNEEMAGILNGRQGTGIGGSEEAPGVIRSLVVRNHGTGFAACSAFQPGGAALPSVWPASS
jgi:hypothetical protein